MTWVRVICHFGIPGNRSLCGAAGLCLPAEVWIRLHPDNKCAVCSHLLGEDAEHPTGDQTVQ